MNDWDIAVVDFDKPIWKTVERLYLSAKIALAVLAIGDQDEPAAPSGPGAVSRAFRRKSLIYN